MKLNMKVISCLIIFIVVIGIIIYKKIENDVTNRENFNFSVENIHSTPVDTKNNDTKENNTMKVIINGNIYTAKIENNETTQALMNKLPLELSMSELNGNEKYAYINSPLPTASSNPKQIEKGDIMLYGDNCLVIFYKSFNTNYSYTKIGHIDNLPNLNSDNITIRFEN